MRLVLLLCNLFSESRAPKKTSLKFTLILGFCAITVPEAVQGVDNPPISTMTEDGDAASSIFREELTFFIQSRNQCNEELI